MKRYLAFLLLLLLLAGCTAPPVETTSLPLQSPVPESSLEAPVPQAAGSALMPQRYVNLDHVVYTDFAQMLERCDIVVRAVAVSSREEVAGEEDNALPYIVTTFAVQEVLRGEAGGEVDVWQYSDAITEVYGVLTQVSVFRHSFAEAQEYILCLMARPGDGYTLPSPYNGFYLWRDGVATVPPGVRADFAAAYDPDIV